jgi:N-acetyl-gamma-glutamyl-phosphate reductase
MQKSVALLHGAGYAGGELIRLLLNHPNVALERVTSRSQAGEPIWHSHPTLRHQTDLCFSNSDDPSVEGIDAVFIAAEHGQSARLAADLLDRGFDGSIIDLSADFRLRDASLYPLWYGSEHPRPDLLPHFQYGMAEVYGAYAPGTRLIANPGCFATGIALALWPLSRRLDPLHAAVTALTGASGSGAKPSATTHFPTRDGNVRAYKVMGHQHTPEIQQCLGEHVRFVFTPVSGPWVRGIWGTAHITLPAGVDTTTVGSWFEEAYGSRPFVRLWPNELPELRFAVGTPFCDLGWIVRDGELVVAFSLDNLLKGAASQAVQNLNLVYRWPETAGLTAAAAPVDVATY